MSGQETTNPCLRNLEELYETFERYYMVFNPLGGSAVPGVLMTAKKTQLMNMYQ